MEGSTSLFINFENTARKLYTHREISYAFSQIILLIFLVNIKYKIFDPIASSLFSFEKRVTPSFIQSSKSLSMQQITLQSTPSASVPTRRISEASVLKDTHTPLKRPGNLLIHRPGFIRWHPGQPLRSHTSCLQLLCPRSQSCSIV
jgi:hypothetical protein